jgi:hypothetical protein
VEIEQLTHQHPIVPFHDCYIDGFGFDEEHRILWPKSYEYLVKDVEETAIGRPHAIPIVSEALHVSSPNVHPLNPYQPEGMYVPMSTDFLGTPDIFFESKAWSSQAWNGASSNGTKGNSDVEKPEQAVAS